MQLIVIAEKNTQFPIVSQYNPSMSDPSSFILIISVTEEGEVATKYVTNDGIDVSLSTTGKATLNKEVSECGHKFTELEITFNGHYGQIKELSEKMNKYCSKASQTVKLVGSIDAKYYDFKFKDAATAILEQVEYIAKFNLLEKFPKMESLVLMECQDEKSMYLSENIPHVTQLNILFAHPSSIEKAINNISKMRQLTKLALANYELLTLEMHQIASLPKLDDLTLHWVLGNDFQERIIWFLGLTLNLKKFTIIASQGGVPEYNFNNFVDSLKNFFSTKLENTEQTVGETTFTASFYLKVPFFVCICFW